MMVDERSVDGVSLGENCGGEDERQSKGGYEGEHDFERVDEVGWKAFKILKRMAVDATR